MAVVVLAARAQCIVLAEAGTDNATVLAVESSHGKEWWWGGLGILVAGVMFFIYRLRVNVLRRNHHVAQERALESQRRRISRDLHDQVGASLSQITRLSEELPQHLSGSKRGHGIAREVTHLAREVTESLRDLLWVTNPRFDTLDNLIPYLREQAATQLDSAQIQCEFEFPEKVPILEVTADFRHHLLLIVREALHNVAKHSRASKVFLRVEVGDPDVLRLDIRDNGCGLPAHSEDLPGQGLRNIQERVEDLRGTLTVRSEQDQGTELHLEVPLPGT